MTTLRAVALMVALVGCRQQESAPPGASNPLAPSSSPAAAPAASTASDPARARQLIASGAVVLDVRTPEEFAGDHVKGAENIPVEELEAHLNGIARLVGGDKTRPIVVYCASGNRSKKAAVKLAEAGYTNVVNGGGVDDLL